MVMKGGTDDVGSFMKLAIIVALIMLLIALNVRR
jgi:hypothetical protein